jgi:predicted O-methyltransferase YrrM
MQKLYGEDIWDGFKPTVFDEQVQGWNGNHPSLSRLARTPGSKVVVDVGVWKGQSTINLAKSLKEAEIDGCIIAVDTFLGSPEHWDRKQHFFERKFGLPNLYDIFMSNVYNAGLADFIVPLPQTSVTAALVLQRLGIKASLVHIDAAHEYAEVLRDAQEYWKILESGGYLIGDDYHVTWTGVVRAAGEFSAQVVRPLQIDDIKWIIQKA